jgi:hypothetical protein
MSILSQLESPLFEVEIVQRRLRWDWCLRDRSGKIVMEGREKSRVAARYHSGRALFLLLLVSCRHSVIRPA